MVEKEEIKARARFVEEVREDNRVKGQDAKVVEEDTQVETEDVTMT